MIFLRIILLEIDWPAWIQAIASVITAVGLVITIYLQQRYTQHTLDMLMLERERDKRSLMPSFEIREPRKDDEGGLILPFICKDNPMKMIVIEPVREDLEMVQAFKNELKPGESVDLVFPADVLEDLKKQSRQDYKIHEVHFYDNALQPYMQLLHYNGRRFSLGFPTEPDSLNADTNPRKTFWKKLTRFRKPHKV